MRIDRRCAGVGHLLDDSTVPGYALTCLVCGQLWKYGPRAGAHRWKQQPSPLPYRDQFGLTWTVPRPRQSESGGG